MPYDKGPVNLGSIWSLRSTAPKSKAQELLEVSSGLSQTEPHAKIRKSNSVDHRGLGFRVPLSMEKLP